MENKLNLSAGNNNSADIIKPEIKNKETEFNNNNPYLDKRYITISLTPNHNLYRKANALSIGNVRPEYIGSSITSSQILCSNEAELNKYFPKIIGISSNHPDFIIRVKNWINNIKEEVKPIGLKLNISFKYNTYKDYAIILEEEKRIESEYEKAPKNTPREIKEALDNKIYSLNALESSKFDKGDPVNIENYLLYRHCLLYKDVAKDEKIIDFDTRIRFYIKDEDKEKQRNRKLHTARNIAKSNYLKLISDKSKLDAVYAQYCVIKDINIIDSNKLESYIKEERLEKYSNEDPFKFNQICNDKHIIVKGFIETLISAGELIRHTHSQNISTSDGTFIGSNMNEAIAYFNSPDNKNIYDAYLAKIKFI